jgi:hypothetical protein
MTMKHQYLSSPALALLLSFALAGCDSKSPAQKSRNVADFTIRDLDGTWAWYGVENCWNNGNTISFDHKSGDNFEIKVRYYQATVFDVPGATAMRGAQKGMLLMMVKYALQGRQYEEHYNPINVDQMRVVGSFVDGLPQKLSSINQPDRLLVRCKDNDIHKK